ncbi:hypothetical protein AGMMS49942_09540 [Spirochaetia bacterium]|nr:hypothetical protein AGMMS49942_09540 [Spirochaetia bacterium]
MVNKFLIPVLLLAVLAPMPAEEDNFIEQRLIQRISWEHDPLVFRYEVILEEELEGEYKEQLRESTTENSLSLSLRPGRYRYAIQVYNLYRKLEYTMDWEYFTVLSAIKPEVLTFSPEVFFLDSGPPWQLTLTGRNIDPQAFIVLRLRGIPVENAEDIRPLGIALEGESLAVLTFNREQLVPGDYNVVIRNPGGLEDTLGILKVQLQKTPHQRPDIIVSAGYAPAIPLNGGLFNGDVFPNPAFPLGINFRFGLLPLKRSWGSLGAELSASWYKMEDQKDTYTVAAQDIGAYLNLLYQWWLPWLPKRPLALNFRLGVGVNLVTDFYFDYGDGAKDPMSSAYFSLDTGLSFQWRFKGPFFIDAGADFIHIFSPDDNSPWWYFRPSLSFGGQF